MEGTFRKLLAQVRRPPTRRWEVPEGMFPWLRVQAEQAVLLVSAPRAARQRSSPVRAARPVQALTLLRELAVMLRAMCRRVMCDNSCASTEASSSGVAVSAISPR